MLRVMVFRFIHQKQSSILDYRLIKTCQYQDALIKKLKRQDKKYRKRGYLNRKERKMLSFALIRSIFNYACNCLLSLKGSAYGRVNFEGRHFICFHRLDTGFPNFQLKLLADVQFHWLVMFATIVQHGVVIIAVSRLVVEGQLQRNSLTINTNNIQMLSYS